MVKTHYTVCFTEFQCCLVCKTFNLYLNWTLVIDWDCVTGVDFCIKGEVSGLSCWSGTSPQLYGYQVLLSS